MFSKIKKLFSRTVPKNKDDAFVLWFDEVGIEDVPLVGGKNAALGEMYRNLTPLGIKVPNGFALTAHAYRFFLQESGLERKLRSLLTGLDTRNVCDLQRRGRMVRQEILKAELPQEIKDAALGAYMRLTKEYEEESGRRRSELQAMTGGVSVAVRSSATAEDLPGASFAGQQETYLNVVGEEELIASVKKCIASLFTDRAISYRVDKGFSHFDVALSVGVQKMVRSDLAASGVAFTLDTETGFPEVVVINSSYGLGEMIVQGKVTPDEFMVWKPGLSQGFKSLIVKNLGVKSVKMVYAEGGGSKETDVSENDRQKFSLNEEEVLKLAKWCVAIENYFSEKHGRRQPMDIEWAKDGNTNELFIVQARPETVHSTAQKNIYKEYRLKGQGKALVSGAAVGTKIASGRVRIIKSAKKIAGFGKGEILVTEITDPEWEPIMKIASAIVTDKGGRTSHAAIVSRELGIPCIVGTGNATKVLKNGEKITVDCSSGEIGKVYAGEVPFQVIEHHLDKIPKTRTKIMVNIGSPDEAFANYYLPAKGVGLGRLEFIIAAHIKIHPLALLDYERLKNSKEAAERKIAAEVDKATPGYKNKADFYVDELAEGIAKIGAAFYPHEVIIRFSDFKTNEYRALLGGELYEPPEENPMLGWRGASRYYDPKFERAFGLEVKALKRVQDEFGLKNIVPMVPFCRTPEEGRKVRELIAKYSLNDTKVYVMCEIPSNVLRADEFLEIFDGMSIGSNDLTQLVLGLDRDSGLVTHIANENDPAVLALVGQVIDKCRKKKKYIGICGQAPSDYPEFAAFLVRKGIDSISLNPDTLVKVIPRIAEAER